MTLPKEKTRVDSCCTRGSKLPQNAKSSLILDPVSQRQNQTLKHALLDTSAPKPKTLNNMIWKQTKDHLQSSRSHGNGDADQENASKSQRRVPTPVLIVRPPASRGTPHTFWIPFVVRRIVRYVVRNIPMPSPHHRSLLCVWSVLVRVQCFSRSLSHARESLRGKAIRHAVQGSETNERQNVSFISAGRNWGSLRKRPWALFKNTSVVRLFEFIEIRPSLQVL